MQARPATPDDAEAIARIYDQGIEDRVATFETTLRRAEDVRGWFDGHLVVVVEQAEEVVAFASSSPYRTRACYARVTEFSVCVERQERAALDGLIAEATAAGYWKLLSRIFVENAASRHLFGSLGFREVGVYISTRPARRDVARRGDRGETAHGPLHWRPLMRLVGRLFCLQVGRHARTLVPKLGPTHAKLLKAFR